MQLPEYSPNAIHGTELAIDDIRSAATDLLEMPRAQRAALPYMHPGRVDVIGAGGLVWRRILERMGGLSGGRIVTATASEHDILDGIALSIS
jgi:exopolyphosphatase/guanosine-5'-triphosphate,3'-diphosphate pyrophosphatase